MNTKIHICLQITIVMFCCYLINTFIIADSLYYNSYSDILATDRIKELIQQADKYRWLVYALSPLVIVKYFLITCVLYIGFFFTEQKIKFAEIFRIVVLAEYVFLFSLVLNTGLILFSSNIHTFDDIQGVNAFSLLNFFDTSSIPKWAIYPLKTLNIFEIIYVFALGYFVAQKLELRMIKGTESIVVPYVLGLCSWIVLVVFLTFGYS